MSTQGDLNEANIRVKRWLKAVETVKRSDGRALVINPGSPEVRTSALWPPSTRWRVYERLKWSLDGTADGKTVDAEACVAAAQTAPEVVQKYTVWVRDDARLGYFQDAHLRGKSLYRPPPDPPEWAAHREAMAQAVDKANENFAAWVKRAAKARMAHIGMDDPVKFELAWERAVAMGVVKK